MAVNVGIDYIRVLKALCEAPIAYCGTRKYSPACSMLALDKRESMFLCYYNHCRLQMLLTFFLWYCDNKCPQTEALFISKSCRLSRLAKQYVLMIVTVDSGTQLKRGILSLGPFIPQALRALNVAAKWGGSLSRDQEEHLLTSKSISFSSIKGTHTIFIFAPKPVMM